MSERQQSSFCRFLQTRKNSRIFLEVLDGNNGDQLILKGMREVLGRHGIIPVHSPRDADLILLNGGGAMNDLWPTGAAQVLDRYMKEHPGKEYVVGPSSYYFTKLDFRQIVGQAAGRTILFCRERISQDHLQNLKLPSSIHIEVSSDLAFELEGSDFVNEQIGLASDTHVLCALRKDREGAGGVLAKTSAPWLPRRIRIPMSRLRDRLVARRSTDVLDPILESLASGDATRKIVWRDVSVSVPFDEFCGSIRSARAVVTNRLHVAIFAALLSKDVHLIQGSYHKIRGVFEMDLAERENTRLY